MPDWQTAVVWLVSEPERAGRWHGPMAPNLLGCGGTAGDSGWSHTGCRGAGPGAALPYYDRLRRSWRRRAGGDAGGDEGGPQPDRPSKLCQRRLRRGARTGTVPAGGRTAGVAACPGGTLRTEPDRGAPGQLAGIPVTSDRSLAPGGS